MGPTIALGPGSNPGPYKVLADDEVRYVGDPYAMVVAESRALAEDAAELIELDLEPLPPVADYTAGLASGELVHPDSPENRAGGMPLPLDDELRAVLDAAPTPSPRPSSRTGTSPCRWRPAASSPSWDRQRAAFDVWVSTQSPHDVRTVTSRITGVPEAPDPRADGRRRRRLRSEGVPRP